MTSRREFLSAALIGLSPKTDRPIAGKFVDDSVNTGHALRDHRLQSSSSKTIRVPVVIVGGGIAGLSAAWHLEKAGFRDFVLLEMNGEAGGNSRSGRNEISAYPWAAHYIPVPGRQPALVRELMQELGAFDGEHWNERYLCFTPQERIFLHGRWQEGLEPEVAATREARQELKRFQELMGEMNATGRFAIPVDRGKDAGDLDRINMQDWLREHKFRTPYLHWYVDYACRDDYGAHMRDVSAWAGVHYFAARAQADDRGPLTWPEGNGWVVKRLLAKLGQYVRVNSPAYRIVRERRLLRVHTPLAAYVADAVIFSAPTFLARHLVEGGPEVPFVYSPWVTANVTLDRMPRDIAKGEEPAWDNVFYDSPSLGYVVATHMNVASRSPERSVWTWYMALADGSPTENRKMLLGRPWEYWRDVVLNDLARAHSDIRECVSRVDVMRMGHAMVRPVVGAATGEVRRRLAAGKGPLFYANSDLSGISIFEEAQYRGVQAAVRALDYLR